MSFLLINAFILSYDTVVNLMPSSSLMPVLNL